MEDKRNGKGSEVEVKRKKLMGSEVIRESKRNYMRFKIQDRQHPNITDRKKDIQNDRNKQSLS